MSIDLYTEKCKVWMCLDVWAKQIDNSLWEHGGDTSSGELYVCLQTGFIGLVAELYDLVTRGDVKAADDDQLFYTKLFLDEQLRVSPVKWCFVQYSFCPTDKQNLLWKMW